MICVLAFALVSGLVGLFGWILWSRDRFKAAFYEAMEDNSRLEEVVESVTEENTYIKEHVVALYKKPVYALITDKQIEQIGQIVAATLKEPKWLN